ncbi:hypothetical protein R1sor_006714 [Riccia sorocarpa]|uniref:Uncharacterized protein n=1 Tax=Riccia sorocarpa TaxID=122646 RepID=A0ABD3HN81_9MARC
MAVMSSAIWNPTLMAAAAATPSRQLASATSFSPLGLPSISYRRKSGQLSTRGLVVVRCAASERPSAEEGKLVRKDRLGVSSSSSIENALLSAGIALSPYLLGIENANAAGGENGILEGRTFALVHPVSMGALLVYTLWAGYLGFQWRRVREIQGEINELKKQVKPVAVAAGDKPAAPSPPSPVDSQISKLTEERKELVKGNFRDKHFNAGSILLGGGVSVSILGCINTYLRTGKLFPGPHLFAGAGITVLWALAAALVPSMQKGDETARSLHIGLNALNVILFLWQVPTGLEIVGKVFEFTSWP